MAETVFRGESNPSSNDVPAVSGIWSLSLFTYLVEVPIVVIILEFISPIIFKPFKWSC